QDPHYIKNLTRKLLLDNQHRVRLTLRPDTQLSARKVNAELTRLEQIKANLVAADREAIVARAQALKERQAKPSGPEDEAILPKVGLEDIPRALAYTPRHQQLDTPIPLTTYRRSEERRVGKEWRCRRARH